MEQRLFNNASILDWLQYYADNTTVDLEKVKILDITRKNKNLIPTVESNSCVLVFTDVGHPDIFYRMWDAGLGECEVWYNEGSDPCGPILNKPVKDMINRGINASAAMLILNPRARTTYKIGMDNSNFTRTTKHYVGAEVRAIIVSKMNIEADDVLCVIGAPAIAVESAILAPEGTIISVEYSENDRRAVEENAHNFGVNNIEIIDRVSDETMAGKPMPLLTTMIATGSTEREIECLLRVNPKMKFIIYTLDFLCAASMPATLEKYGIRDMEVMQIGITKLNAKNNMEAEPAPWIIYGQGR